MNEILNHIDDWKRVNPVSFEIINKFKDSDKFHFIEKIYTGYNEILNDDNVYSYADFIGGIIQPFDSREYIDFNLRMLKYSAKSDYLLAEYVIWNLITLRPKGIENEIMSIYNSGVNEQVLSSFFRLFSLVPSKRSEQILKSYLKNEDWLIRNSAFNEIQRKYELDNRLWYNDEEKA